MKRAITVVLLAQCILPSATPQTEKREAMPARPADPGQIAERTCFQTQSPRWSPMLQLRSDVAMCYGIDANLPGRIAEWKAQGYIAHLMTGVSWGKYQDYLYGRFDGVQHVDEAQTDRNGNVISHGGDVYYMSPGENFGKFLCHGVKQAMDAGAEAIHLEEPEFWVRGGYCEGFKREWKAYYGEDWVAPALVARRPVSRVAAQVFPLSAGPSSRSSTSSRPRTPAPVARSSATCRRTA